MNPKLREINQQKSADVVAALRHEASVQTMSQVSDTIVTATASLVRYLEGHVTKTEVINQLDSIGTPDALKIIPAIDSLHETLKTHKNTDLTEVTKVMQGILDETKQIPKSLPDSPEQKFIDYTTQLSSLADAVKAVEKVVKEQKLVAEAPIVNVPAPNVNVPAPDLEPLQSGIKDVVTAVKRIVIPEYKTDNKGVEKLLTTANKLLKGILERPISSGGGGGGRVSPYSDTSGQPSFVSLTPTGAIPVDTGDTLVTRLDDSTTPNVIYIGKAVIGTITSAASWQIEKLDITSGLIKTWAGTGGFNQVWDDRVTVTYS